MSVCNKLLLINDDLSRRCEQKGGSDYGDVSPMPLESHDPWAKSLHSIMNEGKMIESVGTNGTGDSWLRSGRGTAFIVADGTSAFDKAIL